MFLLAEPSHVSVSGAEPSHGSVSGVQSCFC